MSKIIDLSVPIGTGTLSPPSVNTQLELTFYHRGPGFWQTSKVEMLMHTGSHVDFSKHVQEDGETATDVSLDRVCGEALVVDLSFAEPNHEISVADLEEHAPEIQTGDISKINIKKKDSGIVLVKEAGKWLIGDKKYPADKFMVESMLNAVSGLTLTALASESKNYAIYELDEKGRVSVEAFSGDDLLRKINLLEVLSLLPT